MTPMNHFVEFLNRVAKVFWGAFKETPAGFFAPLVAFWHAVQTNATPPTAPRRGPTQPQHVS